MIQQLNTWFYNHNPEKKSGQPTIKIVLGREKERTVLTETQIYSKEFGDRVKEKADLAAGMVAPAYRLDARNKAAARALADESEAVKEEVRRRHEEMKRERLAAAATLQSTLSTQGAAQPTPMQQLR